MEGTPGHVDLDEVRNAIAAVPGVEDVHDLHIWTITSGMEALSGHVVVADGQPGHAAARPSCASCCTSASASITSRSRSSRQISTIARHAVERSVIGNNAPGKPCAA